MNVILDHDRCVLLHGDCRYLSLLPDNSVDSIVCDPPYLLMTASGKGFMGREWDGVKLIEGETIGQAAERWHRMWAKEALRVLKPGGHIIAFSGSRTQHRMYSAMEDVGFEIRDVLQWMYGQGMPKSLDVSKAVDKSDAGRERRRALEFTAWMRSTGLTAAQLNEATGSCMGSHYVTDGSQPQIPTREHLDAIVLWATAHFDLREPLVVPDEIEELVGRRVVLSEQFAQRPVIDIVEMVDTSKNRPGFSGATYGGDNSTRDVAITEPFSAEAKRWSGWGTALKPFYEPAVLARKPLADEDGYATTVAGCVLDWGTGGINVDACRIGEGGQGRWPSNVIMSHHEDCVPAGEVSEDHAVRVGEGLGADSRELAFGYGKQATTTTTTTREVYTCHPDCPVAILDAQSEKAGGASRFLYCAKPSRDEKEIGLDHLPVKSGSDITGREEGSAGINHPRAGAGAKGGARNTHVTVKPVELMRYLCRLVTPPGGTVLDVFAGSGTTGVAALAEGFSFIGVELGGDDGSHLPIIEGRLRHALGLPVNRAHATPEWLAEHPEVPADAAAWLAEHPEVGTEGPCEAL